MAKKKRPQKRHAFSDKRFFADYVGRECKVARHEADTLQEMPERCCDMRLMINDALTLRSGFKRELETT